jgi:Arc/MetJ-type ribon-helix-helix transcriptional regulator
MSAMGMKIVTINIPDQYLDCIEVLVNNGFFPSRSETVREALKEFLTNEAEVNKGLDPKVFAQGKAAQMRVMDP